MSQYWTIYSVKHQIFQIENKNCTKNVVQTTLSLNDVFNVNVVFKWRINDWRIESILIGWLIPYCVVIGWHIFQFTLISYKIFYHYGRRSELVKKKEWALLLFIPLLFSVNFCFCIDFYKWRPRNCYHFSFVLCLRCWFWGFVLVHFVLLKPWQRRFCRNLEVLPKSICVSLKTAQKRSTIS